MGDRCHIEVQCREVDAPTFEKRGFYREVTKFEGIVCMVQEEGYACDFPESIPFVGNHGSGHDYGPGLFACDGETYVEVASAHDGDLFVMVDAEGTPLPIELQYVRTFIEIDTQARTILGISPR